MSPFSVTFANGAIGKFAHLSAAKKRFIQAGSNGTPSHCIAPDHPEVKGHWEFIRRTGSEPWYMECFDSAGVREWADGYFTLKQVKRAFVGYSWGDPSWRQEFTWVEASRHPLWKREFAVTEAECRSFTYSTTMLDLLRTKASERNLRKVLAIESKVEIHARLDAETDAEYAAQCDLLRDIFGYPP
jgi:hypothetical protein